MSWLVAHWEEAYLTIAAVVGGCVWGHDRMHHPQASGLGAVGAGIGWPWLLLVAAGTPFRRAARRRKQDELLAEAGSTFLDILRKEPPSPDRDLLEEHISRKIRAARRRTQS